jgi:ABC-type long-subunit fatty acid transport system fused permease/ATPase subunit
MRLSGVCGGGDATTRMLREFFLARSSATRAAAWAGLLVFVLDSVYRAQVQLWMADWYSKFYDAAAQNVATGPGNKGSASLAELRLQVQRLLEDFVVVVAPLLVLGPACGWARSRWVYAWRECLILAYSAKWDPGNRPLEGAAQRVHEDTMRFASGVQTCFSSLVDALVTLCTFVPALVQLGHEVRPSWAPDESWLLWVAVAGSVGGFAVTALVAHPLVKLELANQVTEAALRTELVLHEEHRGGCRSRVAFIVESLRKNYKRLYAVFFAVNVWLAAYRQTFVLLPYLLSSPLLFADDLSERISIGTLMKSCSVFGTVFGSLSVVTNGWAEVNVWRSTIHRLRVFERSLRENPSKTKTQLTSSRGGTNCGAEVDACVSELPTASGQ